MGVLSRFGIGNATVDLLVPDTVRQGETVEATVEVEGGSDEQEVEGIYAFLRSEFHGEDAESTWTITEYGLIDDEFTITPDTSEAFDVSMHVPEVAPPTTITRSAPPVWIDTGLDIELAVDPDDRDQLTVEPGGTFATVHEAVTDRLGFGAYATEVVQRPGFTNFAAEVEYRPTGAAAYDLDELELILVSHGVDGLELRVEVDHPSGSVLDLDEDHYTLTIPDDDSAEEVADRFRRLIER